MADEEVVAVDPLAPVVVDEQAPDVPEEEAPVKPEKKAKAKKYVALPGNCAGELELLPAEAEGLTFNMYKCKECGQRVHVGHEHLDLYGLPPEHAKLEEE
jgi:hypothetical protein